MYIIIFACQNSKEIKNRLTFDFSFRSILPSLFTNSYWCHPHVHPSESFHSNNRYENEEYITYKWKVTITVCLLFFPVCRSFVFHKNRHINMSLKDTYLSISQVVSCSFCRALLLYYTVFRNVTVLDSILVLYSTLWQYCTVVVISKVLCAAPLFKENKVVNSSLYWLGLWK